MRVLLEGSTLSTLLRLGLLPGQGTKVEKAVNTLQQVLADTERVVQVTCPVDPAEDSLIAHLTILGDVVIRSGNLFNLKKRKQWLRAWLVLIL